MDDGIGAIIGIVLVIAAVIFVVYIITIIATAVLGVAVAGGSIWGGSRAIMNYGKSFKENMIDSNRAAA